ncbi:DUF4417 domain-containing protein [Mobiluncus mulieris]|nr:DUF4417 domain-containing protein [Mobiluncus mulieris]MCV0012852.1 DUF4417 domain-containing protein [Mobiluncus mulieris]NMW60175.1 DUF4417 domain-containing protein [Mobiluncus mulieris]PNL43857.1 hypothetical protein CEP82_008730 [Mobiluncus mulieris]
MVYMTSIGSRLQWTQPTLPGMEAKLVPGEAFRLTQEHGKVRQILFKDAKKLRVLKNAHLLKRLSLRGESEIPQILPCSTIPKRLVAWSEAKLVDNKSGAWLHFYEDDYKFKEIWDDSELLFSTAREFDGIISPDFSLYYDAPYPVKLTNTYRNQLLGAAAQARGIPTIANVRLSGRDSACYALAGVPHKSVIALGLHGTVKEPENRAIVRDEIEVIVNTVEPIAIVVYGSDAYGVLDYPAGLDIPIYVFPADTYTRSRDRRVA